MTRGTHPRFAADGGGRTGTGGDALDGTGIEPFQPAVGTDHELNDGPAGQGAAS